MSPRNAMAIAIFCSLIAAIVVSRLARSTKETREGNADVTGVAQPDRASDADPTRGAAAGASNPRRSTLPVPGSEPPERGAPRDEEARMLRGEPDDRGPEKRDGDQPGSPRPLPDGGWPLDEDAGWDDPTNDRVLGPKSWMAPVDQEELARIDETFERSRALRHDPNLSNRDRRSSIESVRPVVDRCYEALATRVPGIEGRIILGWRSGASNGSGWVRDPRIVTNYRLDDEQFESCVLSGMEGLRFPSGDGDAIEVEHPFFYDGK